ncbi:hypothetical protein A8B79_01140 [Balneola sp. EhC07]|nr:hypothetical protein A8B79_01140 [Balneola sp. EhC07]
MIVLHYFNLVIITISTINVFIACLVSLEKEELLTNLAIKQKKPHCFEINVAFGIWCLLFKTSGGR